MIKLQDMKEIQGKTTLVGVSEGINYVKLCRLRDHR